MKKSFLVLAIVATLFGAASLLKADGVQPSYATAFEYRHLLIVMDRDLGSYEKSDAKILAPLQQAGEEGWELVSANEPANGVLVHGRATVEFFLKRARR